MKVEIWRVGQSIRGGGGQCELILDYRNDEVAIICVNCIFDAIIEFEEILELVWVINVLFTKLITQKSFRKIMNEMTNIKGQDMFVPCLKYN